MLTTVIENVHLGEIWYRIEVESQDHLPKAVSVRVVMGKTTEVKVELQPR